MGPTAAQVFLWGEGASLGLSLSLSLFKSGARSSYFPLGLAPQRLCEVLGLVCHPLALGLGSALSAQGLEGDAYPSPHCSGIQLWALSVSASGGYRDRPPVSVLPCPLGGRPPLGRTGWGWPTKFF